MELVAVDFYSSEKEYNSKILVVTDYYSRYLFARPVKSADTEHSVAVLSEIFDLYGYPAEMKTDNGMPFKGTDFKGWCEEKGIEQIHSTPLFPQQNGQVEKTMQFVSKNLTIAKIEKKKMATALQEAVTASRWAVKQWKNDAMQSLRKSRSETPCS